MIFSTNKFILFCVILFAFFNTKLLYSSAEVLNVYNRSFDKSNEQNYESQFKLANAEEDTLAPSVSYDVNCFHLMSWFFSGLVVDMPEWNSSKLDSIIFMKDSSYNFYFQHDLNKANGNDTIKWELSVIDSIKDAKAIIRFVDKNGNDTTIVIEYVAPNWDAITDYDFGSFTNGIEKRTYNINITNRSRGFQTLKKIDLTGPYGSKYNYKGFVLDSINGILSKPFAPNESRQITVSFVFDDKLPHADLKYYQAYITFVPHCSSDLFYTKLSANLGIGKIEVSDLVFEKLDKNVESEEKEVIIKNTGNYPIKISRISSGSFVKIKLNDEIFTGNKIFPKALELEVNEAISLFVTVKSQENRLHYNSISIDSDVKEYSDNICEIVVNPYYYDIYTKGCTWSKSKKILLKDENVSNEMYILKDNQDQIDPLTFTNRSNQDIYIKGMKVVSIKNDNSLSNEQVLESFYIKHPKLGLLTLKQWSEIENDSIFISPISGLKMDAYFQPKTIGNYSVVVEFITNYADVYTSIYGTAYAAGVEITPLHYFSKTFPNETLDIRKGELVIKTFKGNYSADVEIQDIISSSGVSNDIDDFKGLPFRYDGNVLYKNLKIKAGDFLRVPIHFLATDVKEFIDSIEIVSNAGKIKVRAGFDTWSCLLKGIGKDFGSNIEDKDKAEVMFKVISSSNQSNDFLAEFSLKQDTELELYLADLRGNKINEIKNGLLLADTYSIPIETVNFSSGIYFVVLRMNEVVLTKKIVVK